MLPHVHIGGTSVVLLFLAIVVAFGSTHLLAASYPNNKLSQGWTGLGF